MDTDLQWPLIFDTQRLLYKAYGFERGSWWSILSPKSIWSYLKLIFAGQRVGESGSDLRQLGGEVLIDPQGNVRLQHASSGPHDRSSIDQICDIVEKAEN